MIILARHGETPANDAHLLGSAESRVQGFSKEMPLTQKGELQSRALGRLLGQFVSERLINVSTVYSSDALRATSTRDHLLDAAEFDPSPASKLVDARLRELNKGNLEGMLRSEAYPNDEARNQQATDWHFRHGTPESGGETAYEAGLRWLGWFNETVDTARVVGGPARKDAIIVVGHSLVTSYGLWTLTHPDEIVSDNLSDLTASHVYKTDNASALVLDYDEEQWAITDRIVMQK